MVDPLVHRAHVIALKGASYRLRDCGLETRVRRRPGARRSLDQADQHRDELNSRTSGYVDPASAILGVSGPAVDAAVAETLEPLGEGVGGDRLFSGEVGPAGSASVLRKRSQSCSPPGRGPAGDSSTEELMWQGPVRCPTRDRCAAPHSPRATLRAGPAPQSAPYDVIPPHSESTAGAPVTSASRVKPPHMPHGVCAIHALADLRLSAIVLLEHDLPEACDPGLGERMR